jgi:hypothetical protein
MQGGRIITVVSVQVTETKEKQNAGIREILVRYLPPERLEACGLSPASGYKPVAVTDDMVEGEHTWIIRIVQLYCQDRRESSPKLSQHTRTDQILTASGNLWTFMPVGTFVRTGSTRYQS